MSVSRISSNLAAQQIVEKAIAQASAEGLHSLTLRDLARAVGKSTTVIVNLLGAKSGLIQAVGEEALRRDAVFHDDFFGSVAGLPLERDGLVALTQTYLRHRVADDAGFVRIWESLLLDAEPTPVRRDMVERWHTMRCAAWRQHLAHDVRLDPFVEPLVAWLTFEQYYAGALRGRADYEVIAAEGLGAMIDRALGLADGAPTATFWYRDAMVLPQAPAQDVEPEAMRRKLLDIAADQILAGGITAVTNRSVSAVAATSTSTTAYHWPDMRHFVLDAVWHSVFRDMPGHLAGHTPDSDPTVADLDNWSAIIAPTVAIEREAEGFYVKYARLIASICIEARRDPSLRDLAMLLRGPEGGGTYYKRAGVWPADFELNRLAATRFALWIKAEALLACARGRALDEDALKTAAHLLVARSG